jgi:hypothetical protein
MSTADFARWMIIWEQLLCMQRDIAQRQVRGTGTTKFL